MSQWVLARKWRPTSFEYLIGQDHVCQSLCHAIENDRLHHAYLFSGTRGVGKTTIARILVRCLNCENGITVNPCGVCANCSSITGNRFVDLLEVDAASRTKVDDTRELLENVSYVPVQGRYKVYLIDEVHMLSTHSFNALLKTLEEPPEHVIFLLATTDPQKLPPTVLSRCMQFHLRDVGPDLVSKHLEFVLNQESVRFESEALWNIARAGRGSVRDSITLLDQAIAHGLGQVTTESVIQMLGIQGLAELPSILKHAARGEADSVLKLIKGLSRQSPDWLSLVSGLQSLIHQVSVCQVADSAIDHLSPSDKRMVAELAKIMSPEFLQLTYQFSLTGYRDLPLSTDPRSAFEMLILRMIAFRPARHGESISNATLESESNEPEPTNIISDRLCFEDKSRLAEEVSFAQISRKEETVPVGPPKNQLKSEKITQLTSNSENNEVGHDESFLENFKGSDVNREVLELSVDTWVSQAGQLELRGLTGSLLNQTVLVRLNETEVILAASARTVDLLTGIHRKRIADAFTKFCGMNLSLVIETRDNLSETPEGYRVRMKKQALQSARDSFQNDPFVRHLKHSYGAEVSLSSIEPKEV